MPMLRRKYRLGSTKPGRSRELRVESLTLRKLEIEIAEVVEPTILRVIF